MKNRILLSCLAILLMAAVANAQSPAGVWQTIDDGSGEAKSHVQIYAQNGKYHAKIVKLLTKPADTVCEKCPDEKKGQPLIGMVIMWDMEPYKDYWTSGRILDPEKGADYGCTIWFENGNANELKIGRAHV